MRNRLFLLSLILCLLALLAPACSPASPVTPVPTQSPTAVSTLVPAATAVPTAIPPGPTATAKPTATATPAATATPKPTATPTQQPTPKPAPTPPPIPAGNTPTPLPSVQGTLQVHFIDVGQGDSILIQAPDGKTMLIDGGEANSQALEYLNGKGIKSLDLVVATHPHADHIGGLVQVLKAMPVAKVVTNGQPTTTKTYEDFLNAIAAAKAEYVEVKRGDSLRLGDLLFSVLNPMSAAGDDLNNGSVVLRLVYGKASFLFEGDAQAQAEGAMSVSSFSPVQANVLKVAYHGSRSSSTPAFLTLVKPQIAIYSAGKGNSYGDPAPETIAALSAIGAKIYGTDLNGNVLVVTDGNSLQVHVDRQASKTSRQVTPDLFPGISAPTLPTPTPAPSGAIAVPAPTPTPTAEPYVKATVTVLPGATPTYLLQPPITITTISLQLVSLTNRVAPGNNATLVAKTAPGASCSITVYDQSGPSTAQGLDTKTADAGGNVSWTWLVGTGTTPGEWSIVVTATKDGLTMDQTTSFTVG